MSVPIKVEITGPRPVFPDDQLTLIVNGVEISGWEEVEVTLRAEAFPNNFDIRMSSKAPIASNAVVAKAGDKCVVLLGNDQVITGYIDRDVAGADPDSHALQLIGRGGTQDLVDCSAEWPTGQMINGTALTIAGQLAQPYSIDVQLGAGASAGPQVPKFNLNYGEGGADIIQRVARNAGLLAYESAEGHLVLATVGTKRAASGIAYGSNVQRWQIENGIDGRYSDIVCCALSVDTLSDLGGSNFFDKESDPNVPRHRLKYLVLEEVATDPQAFTINKAKWEIARRAGRGTVITATVDSWRDSAGKLWAPNTIVPVDLPGNRASGDLILSEVTFRRSSETGTTADLVVMPIQAFSPEPISLMPVNAADLTGPDQ